MHFVSAAGYSLAAALLQQYLQGHEVHSRTMEQWILTSL